jgi:carboxyl-terminal processing protease
MILAMMLTANLMVGARLYQAEGETAAEDDAYESIHLLTTVLQHIRGYYVDKEKTSYQDLIHGALNGMLQSLDAHSQFMDPDMYSDMKDDTAGQFGGLGVVISLRDEVLTVIAPMEGTPGFEAGLLPGDKIIEIETESTERMSVDDAIKKLRGPVGTPVTIKVLRPETQEIKDFTIIRAEIEVASVKGATLLEDGIGYVRITQFNTPTAEDLQRALDELASQGMKALVLDLRDNPGGLLNAAIEVSQKFLHRDDLVVYTQGRDPGQKQQFRAGGRTHHTELPLAILINRGSASASEIVAGALQDHRRAILVGEKTFGKGSVQSVIGLDDGSAIRLTTAKYYTPSEKVIHERGIAPQIEVPVDPLDWRRIREYQSRPEGALPDPEFAGEPPVDVQLERALDVLKGIMIFEVRRNGHSSELIVRK